MKIKFLVIQCLKKKFPLSLLDVSVHQTVAGATEARARPGWNHRQSPLAATGSLAGRSFVVFKYHSIEHQDRDIGCWSTIG